MQLVLGNPTAASTNPAAADNFLLIKDQYVVSYNRTLGRPNWVSWHLQRSDLGGITRQDDFRPDNSLPASWYQVRPSDYTSADGFDRGHLCPSADRTNTTVNNSATFLMANVVPQAPTLNRGVWAELESYCRELVMNGNELYVLSGVYGSGADGSQGYKLAMATGKVVPPSHCWKVILVLPEGDDDLSRISAQSTVIAVDMLNSQTVRKGWEDYVVTITELEKLTTHSFLSTLSAATRIALKGKRYTIPPVVTPPSTGDIKCGMYNGKQLYRGPQGGCYYINSNGNKTYVDRGYCKC